MYMAALGETRLELDDMAAAENGDLGALQWMLWREHVQHSQKVGELRAALIPEGEMLPQHEFIHVCLFSEDIALAERLSADYVRRRELEQYIQRFSVNRRNRVLLLLFAAVREGHLPVVQWLHGEQDVGTMSLRPGICAVENGRLEILVWLASAGYPVRHKYLFEVAAEHGRLAILRYLVDELASYSGNEIFDSERIYIAAACSGRLDVLEWLHAESVAGRIGPFDHHERVIETAARAGSAECIRWARALAPPDFRPGDAACTNAAAGGHLEILAWLSRDLGFPLSAAACIEVARIGLSDAIDRGGHSPRHEAVLAWIRGGAR
jgi:hypothetical protein